MIVVVLNERALCMVLPVIRGVSNDGLQTSLLTVTIRLFLFQVLAVTSQPVKLSCSRFTTKMDIILSS